MSRLLFDTNALIDLTISTRPQHGAVQELLRAIAEGGHAPLALSATLKDVYYVCCRHYTDETQARQLIVGLRRAFDLVDLTSALVDEALASDEPDLEDGLVRAAAEGAGCDVIVSRDVKAFRTSSCLRLTPSQAIEWLGVS